MIYIGIDGGKKGAIAELFDVEGQFIGPPRITAMPIIPASTGRGRDEYDIASIASFFRDCTNPDGEHTRSYFAVVEKPMPMPPRFKVAGGDERASSGLAQFNRGVQFGFAWMLEALRIPYQLVAPRTWQRVMHEGTPGDDTKQRSILAAQRLFPGIDLRRSPRARKADDGFADALLLAEYARRTKNGGTRDGKT